MYSITELPDDGRFRMVTWIDRRFTAHQRIRRDALTVLMMPVPIADAAHIDGVTSTMVRSWLGRQRSTDSEHDLFDHGDLQLATIGDIFRGKTYVGTIGGSHLSLSMTRNDQDAFTTLGMLRDRFPDGAPAGGQQDSPPSPCDHLIRCFPGSRVLILPHGTTDVLIPRTLIHHQFYDRIPGMPGPGYLYPWPLTSQSCIRTTRTMQGLFATGRCNGDHYLIVRDDIPTPHVRLLANFLFHPYGRACANALYGVALQDATAPTWAPAPVCYSSRIPYPASVEEPLSLRVRGWHLTDPEHDAAHGRRSLFLATRIVSCSEPPSQPQIYYEYEEAIYRPYDGVTTAEIRRRVAKARPTPSSAVAYQKFFQQKAMHAALPHDAVARSDRHAERAAQIHADSFFITDAKPMRLQVRPDDEWDILRNMESFGSYDGDSAPRITLLPPARPSIPQFWNLIQCLIEMVRLCDILEFKVVPPRTAWQVVSCGGIDGWNFLRLWADGLSTPSSDRWTRMARPDAAGNRSNNQPSPRAVQILRIVGHRLPVYWMEIESAVDEPMTSVLLIGLTSTVYETLQIAMSCISDCDGRALHEHLTKRLSDRITSVHVCTRNAESGNPFAMSPTVILQQLVLAGVTAPRGAPTFLQASENACMTDANLRWTGEPLAAGDPLSY
jgi:hypothetical protein